MSTISVAEVKEALRVTHSSDDALLQRLTDGAENEAMRFMNRTQLPTLPQDYPPLCDSEGNPVSEVVPSSEDQVAPDVVTAVFLLVQATYEAVTPDDIAKLRACAETILMPYRVGLGV